MRDGKKVALGQITANGNKFCINFTLKARRTGHAGTKYWAALPHFADPRYGLGLNEPRNRSFATIGCNYIRQRFVVA
jgi:hypothetical protein